MSLSERLENYMERMNITDLSLLEENKKLKNENEQLKTFLSKKYPVVELKEDDGKYTINLFNYKTEENADYIIINKNDTVFNDERIAKKIIDILISEYSG